MANKQALQVEEQFEVVKALYEEAKLTLPAEERAQLVDIQPVDPITSPTENIAGNIAGNESDTSAEQPVIIRSRKPRISANAEPIFTRISDLYEEAEAVKLLAEETDLAASDSDDAHEISSDNAAENEGEHEATPLAASDNQPLSDSDFAIPAEFGANANNSESESESESESDIAAALELVTETDTQTSEPALSEEELALLTQASHADETLDTTDVSISDDIEPAVALDDVLEGLLPPDIQDDQNAQEPPLAASAEAQALSELDANRPQADDALKEQLADVKQAVEQAAATGAEPVLADSSDETEDEGNNDPQDNLQEDLQKDPQEDPQKDMASLTPGPELARFIGETVRDVLDEELPQLVRGLVDETLGERQGRYGRVDTPHIGLRTKPSRH